MELSWSLIVALLSGLAGAVLAQVIAIRHREKMEASRNEFEARREVLRTKHEVLRKIAGNRAAVSDQPILEHRARFFEGLNEVMVVFSDSPQVANTLIEYKAALGTNNANDRLIALFKVVCRDVGIDPTAFNDSLFLQPFVPPRVETHKTA